MTKELTTYQKLKHYSISSFLLLISAFPFIDAIKNLIGRYNGVPKLAYLLLFFFTCLTASTIAFFIKKRQLSFKEFHITCSSQDFLEAAKITSEENKWKIQKISDNHIIGYHNPFFSIRLIVTIKRESDKILINCIHDLDTWSEGITLGWRKKNISDYISNLKRIQEKSPITENAENEQKI